MSTSSRTERLINLTAALLAAERPLSADELRGRVPGYPEEKASFRRQFERDKDALRDLGLPLLMVALPSDASDAQVGYRINPDEYYLRDPGLDPDELSALHLAARVVHLEGLASPDATWKLGAAVPGESALADTTAVSIGTPVGTPSAPASPPVNDALATVFAAIAAGEAVAFSYREVTRTVQPSQLSFRNGRWYIVGYDSTRGDERSFRVDRITGAVNRAAAIGGTRRHSGAGTERFARPWELGDGDLVPTVVRVDAGHAEWAVGHLGPDCVRDRHSNGDVSVNLSVRSVDGFRSFILGFLDHAEVISPPAMREAMVSWLQPLGDEGGPA